MLGPITRRRQPRVLFANESLAQALRQLVLYGRDGLPVISTDGRHLQGWITNQNVLRTVASRIAAADTRTPREPGDRINILVPTPTDGDTE